MAVINEHALAKASLEELHEAKELLLTQIYLKQDYVPVRASTPRVGSVVQFETASDPQPLRMKVTHLNVRTVSGKLIDAAGKTTRNEWRVAADLLTVVEEP